MKNPQLETPSPHQFAEYARQVELRISALEADLTEVKAGLADSPELPALPKAQPWWVEISGSFADNPLFDDAVRYGEEWRKSAE
jgi:hypothetical protein